MTPAREANLYGRIITVSPEGYAFIGFRTVTDERGQEVELETQQDIFLHKDDAGLELKVGKEVVFYVESDRTRGGNALRAFGAIESVEVELLPPDEAPVPGFSLMATTTGAQMAVRNLLPAADGTFKDVPEATVAQVDENAPMSGVPRDTGDLSEEEGKNFISGILRNLYARLRGLGASFKIGEEETALDEAVAESTRTLEEVGMPKAARDIRTEVESYQDVKRAMTLMWEEGAIRTNTVIPIRFLPDLFMAVPVWYHWTKNGGGSEEVGYLWESDDPRPHSVTQYFCNLFKNERWRDIFQLFNRRLRTLDHYEGDIIPLHVTRRMSWATEIFDHVVIATPYHDAAGKDWQNIDWLRSIDPYVLGFKEGLPFFFILARYSDTGVFPHYLEMVADTIEFLRTNKEKLEGFNRVNSPYWYKGNSDEDMVNGLGTRLQQRVDELITAFEAGQLFNWLRGEVDIPSGQSVTITY